MQINKKLPGEIELLDEHWDEEGLEMLLDQINDRQRIFRREEEDE